MTAKGPDTRAWRATLAGLSASLVGIGLARFAYTPLLPVLITAGWFPASQAAYLGAANLAGYLGGALCARPLARWGGAPRALRGMMTLVTVAFFACALPLSFSWFFLWRFASGVAGGTLMVLAAPTVLPHVPPARRGLAGGADGSQHRQLRKSLRLMDLGLIPSLADYRYVADTQTAWRA
jgi:MFS family permease